MSRRRDTVVFGAMVVIGVAITLGIALLGQKPLSHTTSDAWPKLTACKIDKHYVKMTYDIHYTPEVKAMDGKAIVLDGFMLPLESTEKSNHFLLSIRSPTCPYCPPGAPNEIVEIFTKKPMAWSDNLAVFSGTLKLTGAENQTGIFFQMLDAQPDHLLPSHATPPVAVTTPKPMQDYKFTELQEGREAQDVTLAQWRGKPLVVAFWRSDCTPCLQELTELPAIARQHSDLPILLISLQDAAHTRAHLPSLPTNVHVLVAQDDGRELLRALGNERMLALPYSVMLDANGKICSKQYGIIDADKVQQWRKQCS